MTDIHLSDVAFLVAPLAIGIGLTSFLTPSTFRQCGLKSTLQPPGWAFGVAWTALYALVGIAAALAWRRFGRTWHPALAIYASAIGGMMLWWVVFSNWCAPTVAFTYLVATLGTVVAAVALLYRAGAVASAALSLPLIAWLCFASLLAFLGVRPSA